MKNTANNKIQRMALTAAALTRQVFKALPLI